MSSVHIYQSLLVFFSLHKQHSDLVILAQVHWVSTPNFYWTYTEVTGPTYTLYVINNLAYIIPDSILNGHNINI